MAKAEADFSRGKAREAKFAIANERRATQRREKSASSLRAAPKISPYVASAFAKVVHIGCMLRLVWRNFEQQRGSRLKRKQTLSYFLTKFSQSKVIFI
ncbi:hypothetical protein AXE65_11510 [Ventosimonas gracilis]|uniref:Uncharacterized protein n=1 Tax=Ventosimonas gracilis TaxID=1680762 RepID=A0A139SWC2_9GAMM|nr:hypothetical protein AXE65_11510 [Ventosimonas gracilis]